MKIFASSVELDDGDEAAFGARPLAEATSWPPESPAARFIVAVLRQVSSVLEGDYVDSLVFLGVLRRQGGRAPEGGRVTVLSLCGDLGFPYETLRRRSNHLLEGGRITRGPGGLVVSADIFLSEDFQKGVVEVWLLASRLMAEMAPQGAVPPSFRPRRDKTARRVAGLLAIEFILDALRALTRAAQGDVPNAMILLCLLTPESPIEGPLSPVSVYRLAKRLALSYETTRRHALELIRIGLCLRDDTGAVSLAREGPGARALAAAVEVMRARSLAFASMAGRAGLGGAQNKILWV